MLEFADDLARPVAHAVLVVLRVIWWLTWELWLDMVSWYAGWPVCRALSLGHFPSVGLHERESAEGWAGVPVHVTGIATLFGAIYLLARCV